jgi:hypothetical protein
MSEYLSDSEKHEIEDYQKNAIQRFSVVDLSSTKANDDAESFEDRDKYEILTNMFKKNSIFIDPNCRNVLVSHDNKTFLPNDILVHKTKDYRFVVLTEDNCVIIRNSKRMIKVPLSDVSHKVRELTKDNIRHIYDTIRRVCDMTRYDQVSYFMSFSEVFDIDVVDLLSFLSAEDREGLVEKLRNLRKA